MAEWMHKLGSVNQYRDVPYVECRRTGEVFCHLCKTGGMQKHARIAHFNGKVHRMKYNQVKAMKEQEEKRLERGKRVEYARSLEPRINKLGLKRWMNEVRLHLYEYIGIGGLGYVKADIALNNLEQKERLSLLELALWKARSVDGLIFRSTDEIREQQALDANFNASSYLETQRVLSGCHIIVPKVVEFL